MTNRSVLVIVSGAPATGKTVMARAIATELGLPLFYKDGFKELLFDEFDGPEYASLAFSHKLGRTTFAFLKAIMEEMARAGQPAVVEANFNGPLFSPFAQDLATRYPVEYVRVHLSCEESVRHERCLAREVSAERHPGHRGIEHGGPMPLNPGADDPLAVDGHLIRIDTTDFARVETGAVIVQIRDILMCSGRIDPQ